MKLQLALNSIRVSTLKDHVAQTYCQITSHDLIANNQKKLPSDGDAHTVLSIAEDGSARWELSSESGPDFNLNTVEENYAILCRLLVSLFFHNAFATFLCALWARS